MKRDMSRWDSLPAFSPVSCGPEPICQESIEWNCPAVQQRLVTATRRLSAAGVMLPPCIDKQITASQHSNAPWKIHLHPSALSLCYLNVILLFSLREEGREPEEEPRLLWHRRLWRACAANIKTDGAVSLVWPDGWSHYLHNIVGINSTNKIMFKGSYIAQSKLSKLVKIIPCLTGDRRRYFN